MMVMDMVGAMGKMRVMVRIDDGHIDGIDGEEIILIEWGNR